MGPKTTAVIVTYLSKGTVGSTLAAAEEAHKAGRLHVIVVDNASADGTAVFVRDAFPWVEMIESPSNLGFARACNLGFERIRTPYVLFLNPDATLDLDALDAMETTLDENPEVGILAPAIQFEDGSVQEAGLLTTPRTVIRGGLGRPERPTARRIEPGAAPFSTPCVCGAIMLVRSELFESLHGFDGRYFLYFEETDLCLRAQEFGSDVWATGAAVGTHAGAASGKAAGADLMGGCIVEHFYPSRFYFLRKHFGLARAVTAELVDLSAMAARNLRNWIVGRPLGQRFLLRLRGGVLRLPAPFSDETKTSSFD